jgi:hypothetical protein
MKALSLRQPWAWAIVHAGKRIENRTWNTSLRGDFLIHAAKGCSEREYLEAARWMVERGLAYSPLVALGVLNDVVLRVAGVDSNARPEIPLLDELPRGGIVGGTRLVDVLRPSVDGKPRAPWHMPEQFGFVLASAEELPFRPVKGLQQFFDPDMPGRRVTLPGAP